MILLDTNVVSEAMKPDPAPAVQEWLDAQSAETLFISSVTLAELRFGIGVLPAGKRKAALATVLNNLLALFENRVLAFDLQAAEHYAALAVKARSRGKGFPTPDGYIAAIAAANGLKLATRDDTAFRAGEVEVINPWKVGGQ